LSCFLCSYCVPAAPLFKTSGSQLLFAIAADWLGPGEGRHYHNDPPVCSVRYVEYATVCDRDTWDDNSNRTQATTDRAGIKTQDLRWRGPSSTYAQSKEDICPPSHHGYLVQLLPCRQDRLRSRTRHKVPSSQRIERIGPLGRVRMAAPCRSALHPARRITRPFTYWAAQGSTSH
jgi:hypothetical protein